MKLKKDISRELKNELNLIRVTYTAVIENRIRLMTMEDIEKGIKYYQIVGFEELPELLSDSDEDIEAFVDEIFSKVLKTGVSEEAIIKPRTPEQQALAIDVLDEATIKIVDSYRQGMGGKKRGEKNYLMVKKFLDEHWQAGMKITYIDDCMVSGLSLSLRTVQKNRKRYFIERIPNNVHSKS